MRRATFFNAARRDLRNIAGYIASVSGSADVGVGFSRRLRAKCHELAALPVTLGRPRPELGEGVRSFPYGNYTIFFRYSLARFEVIHLLERHQDVGAFEDER